MLFFGVRLATLSLKVVIARNVVRVNVKGYGRNRSCNYSKVFLKELSKTSSQQAGGLVTRLGYEPKTPLKPLHHPALSTLLVLPYGFSFVPQTVINQSDVLDIFLFPVSAFVSLCLLLIQGFPFSNCDSVVW
jgi:hypothetical protein